MKYTYNMKVEGFIMFMHKNNHITTMIFSHYLTASISMKYQFRKFILFYNEKKYLPVYSL